MKNEILRRLSALALGLALLLNAAPLPQAFAVEDDTDASSSDSADSTDTADKTAVTTADSDPTVTAAAANAPALDATAALLVSPESDMVLYEKNADEKRYPASTTKIMTALLTLENVSDLSAVVTAEASDFENVTADSSNAGIKLGEQVTVKDLLYALMLPSANEAAYMLARHVGGSWEQFVDMMNERAAELGCTGTHFCNPCGLHEDDHYTTAHDLYRIAKQAMKDATFRDIVSTVQHRMAKTNLHEERIILTTNQLIFSSFQPWSYANCLGIKTGHTSQAGNCSSATPNTATQSCSRSCSAARAARRNTRPSPPASPIPRACASGVLRTSPPRLSPGRARRSPTPKSSSRPTPIRSSSPRRTISFPCCPGSLT